MIFALPSPVSIFKGLHSNDGSYQLSAQELHIFYLDIRRFTTEHYAESQSIMSNEERTQAQKIVNGRELYVASRWLLRSVLSRFFGILPAEIEFLHTAKGKPYLHQKGISFSLSHSGHLAVLAVGQIEFIGVDIEVAKLTDSQDLKNIAKDYYHSDEYASLQALTEAEQVDHFYRLWTLKESFFKALGIGIGEVMGSLVINFEGDRINCWIAGGLGENITEWQFNEWLLDKQIYCALAYKSQSPVNVLWYDAIPP